MIPQEEVEAAINDFCRDEVWKKILYSAPAGAMERIAIAFYYAKFLVEKKNSKDQADIDRLNEYRALREEVENSLENEDLEYLASNMPENKRGYYQKLLDDKRKRDEKEAAKAEVAGGTPGEGQQQ